MRGNDNFCMFVCTLIKLLNIRLLPEAHPLIGRVWTCDPVGNNWDVLLSHLLESWWRC